MNEEKINIKKEKVNIKCSYCGTIFKVPKESLQPTDKPIKIGLKTSSKVVIDGRLTAMVFYQVSLLDDEDLCPKCCIKCLKILVEAVERNLQSIMNGEWLNE